MPLRTGVPIMLKRTQSFYPGLGHREMDSYILHVYLELYVWVDDYNERAGNYVGGHVLPSMLLHPGLSPSLSPSSPSNLSSFYASSLLRPVLLVFPLSLLRPSVLSSF